MKVGGGRGGRIGSRDETFRLRVDKRSAGFAGVREGSLQALIHHRHHHPRPRGPSSSFLLWLETSPHLQEEQWESFIWLINYYLATPDWTNSTDTIRYKWMLSVPQNKEVIVRKNTDLLTILLLIFIIVFFLAVHISVHLSILQGQRLLMQTHSASSESVGKSEFPVGNVLWNAPSTRITPSESQSRLMYHKLTIKVLLFTERKLWTFKLYCKSCVFLTDSAITLTSLYSWTWEKAWWCFTSDAWMVLLC